MDEREMRTNRKKKVSFSLAPRGRKGKRTISRKKAKRSMLKTEGKGARGRRELERSNSEQSTRTTAQLRDATRMRRARARVAVQCPSLA